MIILSNYCCGPKYWILHLGNANKHSTLHWMTCFLLWSMRQRDGAWLGRDRDSGQDSGYQSRMQRDQRRNPAAGHTASDRKSIIGRGIEALSNGRAGMDSSLSVLEWPGWKVASWTEDQGSPINASEPDFKEESAQFTTLDMWSFWRRRLYSS